MVSFIRCLIYIVVGTERAHFGEGDFGALITRAKIGLNCHFYVERPSLEIHRIMLMVSHYTLVLSARSGDHWLDDLFASVATFYDDENDFVEKFMILNSLTDVERGQLVMKRLKAFQAMPTFKENFLLSGSVLLELEH